MSRRPATVTQGDVARALRAANAAGLKVARFEIEPNGKVCITIGDGEHIETAISQSPIDDELSRILGYRQ